MNRGGNTLPITVLLAVKNEAVNISRCLKALERAARVVVLDSHSDDDTAVIAERWGAEVVQFDYKGGYPKKRQWALDNIDIATDWVLLLDADEIIPDALWREISQAIGSAAAPSAFMITKGYHFLGRRFRYGGFSFPAVLLFRRGTARFERLVYDSSAGLDMEVHERVVVDGGVGRLSTPLIHEDFKGLEAYIQRHNHYSTWEAKLRYRYLTTGQYGEDTIQPRLFGNSQERRRFLKELVTKLPSEHWIWFFYHYIVRFAVLEGRAGLIASQIRASYISQVRAKVYELKLASGRQSEEKTTTTLP